MIDCIDTKEEEITGYTSNDVRKWDGICAYDGKLYCAPSTAAGVLEIDPVANTTTFLSDPAYPSAAGREACEGVTFAPNT